MDRAKLSALTFLTSQWLPIYQDVETCLQLIGRGCPVEQGSQERTPKGSLQIPGIVASCVRGYFGCNSGKGVELSMEPLFQDVLSVLRPYLPSLSPKPREGRAGEGRFP